MTFKRFSQAITLWRARLSFPNLFEAKPVMVQGRQVGDPRFSTLILPTPEQCVQIQQLEDWLISQSWPQGVPPGVIIKRALVPGEQLRPKDANLAGKLVLSANAKEDSPPQLVSIHRDAAGHFLPLTDRHHVYSGCEANVEVGIYTTQLKTTEPQINCGLNSVQPTERPMDRFDNRSNPDQAFADDPYAAEYAQQNLQGQSQQPPWQPPQQGQAPAQGQPQQPPWQPPQQGQAPAQGQPQQPPWQPPQQGQAPAQGQPASTYPWQQGGGQQ